MIRPRFTTVFLSAVVTLLAAAPIASATTQGGEGLFGETNDVVITNAMFGVMILFAAVIVVFSLIQAALDKRKNARVAAAKARTKSPDWHGGW
jgi:hypothetical protein